MGSRQQLQEMLKSKLNLLNVYYQPPSRLTYPCLVYELSDINTKKADNNNFLKKRRYSLTYFSKEPDPVTVINNNPVLVEDIMLNLPMCSFDRHYVADNIHHYVFTLYY